MNNTLEPESNVKSPELKSYFWTDSILVNFDDSSKVYRELRKVCNELDISILEVDASPDVVALPYFIFFIDPNLITKEELGLLEYMCDFQDYKEIAQLFIKPPKFKLSPKMRKFTLKTPDLLDYDTLKLIILKRRSVLQRRGNNKGSYDKKIYRMMHILLNLMSKKKNINTQDLCVEFGVSEKTILRDIDMLRILGNDIEFDKANKEWKLTFCMYAFDILGENYKG